MKKFCKLVINLKLAFPYLWDKLWSPFYKMAMRYCGKNVYMRPTCSDFKGLNNLSIGDYSSIPKGSVFYCTGACLTIGKRVIFGPCPTIITGDHRIDAIGKYIVDSTVKLSDNDAPVVIEDDVWAGANVTILKGVLLVQLLQSRVPLILLWGGCQPELLNIVLLLRKFLSMKKNCIQYENDILGKN